MDIYFNGANGAADVSKIAVLASFYRTDIPIEFLRDFYSYFKALNSEPYMRYGLGVIYTNKLIQYKLNNPDYRISDEDMGFINWNIGLGECMENCMKTAFAKGDVSKIISESDFENNQNTIGEGIYIRSNILDVFGTPNDDRLVEFYRMVLEDYKAENRTDSVAEVFVRMKPEEKRAEYIRKLLFGRMISGARSKVWQYNDPEEYLHRAYKQVSLRSYIAMIVNANQVSPEALLDPAKGLVDEDREELFSSDIFDVGSLLFWMENHKSVKYDDMEKLSLNLLYMIQSPGMSFNSDTGEEELSTIATPEFKELLEGLVDAIEEQIPQEKRRYWHEDQK